MILPTACSIKQDETNTDSVSNIFNNTYSNKEIDNISNGDKSDISENSELELRYTIEEFIEAIKNNDANILKRNLSPSGLVVIRNFSSGNGTRGKNIRNLFLSAEIPTNLSFEFKGELPIVLHELFKKSQQTDFNDFLIEKISDCNFIFEDGNGKDIIGPATDEIRDICGELVGSIDSDNQYIPKIYILGEKEIVLTESMLIADTPVGEWAVFENIDSNFYLRAIIDLR